MDFEINKLTIDELSEKNRVNGVLAVNKPVDMTSHDVVDLVRKKYGIRKVGHAGALDPFASGVLIVLLGRYTTMSDELMGSDKEYRCKILFGVETDTLDTEGEVVKSEDVDIDNMQAKIDSGVLKSIEKGYMQQVPVFSSVKVNGEKLRVLARKSKRIEIDGDVVTFHFENGQTKQVEIPRKKVVFGKFELGKSEKYSEDPKHAVAELTVDCSKGTYIRQLAKDIGNLLGVPAMLIELERTRVGQITLQDCISVQDLKV